MSDENSKISEDAAWDLLGKAAVKKPSADFAEQTVQATKFIPQKTSSRSKVLYLSSWIAAAACIMLTALFVLKSSKTFTENQTARGSEDQWEEIQHMLDEAYVDLAVNNLDEISNEDLIAYLGF